MLLAHYDRQTSVQQTLEDHLKHTASEMVSDVSMLTFDGIDSRGLRSLFVRVGLYHDSGKAMGVFQHYLKTGEGGMERNHSLISAVLFLLMCKDPASPFSCLAATAIIKHHASRLDLDWKDSGEAVEQLERQFADAVRALRQESLPLPDYKERNFAKEDYIQYHNRLQEFLQRTKMAQRKKINTDQWYFALNYLYSRLIWSDKLDSAGLAAAGKKEDVKTTDNKERLEQSILGPQLTKTVADVDQYLLKKTGGRKVDLDDRRGQARGSVLERIASLSDDEIRTRRIFTLTAPTGLGKTLMALSAALALGVRMERIDGRRPDLITALPFINILEQTQADYQEIFDEVLVHYSGSQISVPLADYEMRDPPNGGDPMNDRKAAAGLQSSGLEPKDQLLFTNAWGSRVVITTFVQLLESVIGTDSSRLLKLNRLAGSIVILDEVQAIPSQYYALVGAVLQRLTQYYGTRFILMTATQPGVIDYANRLLGDGVMSGVELLEDHERYFLELNRTQIVPVWDQVKNNEELVQLVERTKGADQAALVIVNTIAQSIEVYRMLVALGYETLYLSTNLTAADRKKVIDHAKQLLTKMPRHPFILVATQTVEAGVDLSFDVGYRDLAQMESIIQAAGRINRSGILGEQCPLYVFNTGTGKMIYDEYRLNFTKDLLRDPIPEREYLNLVRVYYKRLLEEDTSYDKAVYRAIQRMDYGMIAEFQLIKEQGKSRVLVELDDQLPALMNRCKELLSRPHDDYNARAELKNVFNALGRYTVEVRQKRLEDNLPPRCKDVFDLDLDYYVVPQDDLERYYDVTGFIMGSSDSVFY